MDKMAMTPKGLRLLIVGLLVMVAGIILLSGGGVKDPQVFNYDMFDFRSSGSHSHCCRDCGDGGCHNEKVF